MCALMRCIVLCTHIWLTITESSPRAIWNWHHVWWKPAKTKLLRERPRIKHKVHLAPCAQNYNVRDGENEAHWHRVHIAEIDFALSENYQIVAFNIYQFPKRIFLLPQHSKSIVRKVVSFLIRIQLSLLARKLIKLSIMNKIALLRIRRPRIFPFLFLFIFSIRKLVLLVIGFGPAS